MDSKDRRRQARLQGHLHPPKTRFVSEKETAFDQPNEVNDDIGSSSGKVLEVENGKISKNHQIYLHERNTSSQPEVRNHNRNRGRKTTQRYYATSSNSSKISNTKSVSCNQSPPSTYHVNLDVTVNSLNVLKVNDAPNCQIAGEVHKPINGTYYRNHVHQSSNGKHQDYTNSNEQMHSKSKSSRGRGRNRRNGPWVDRNYSGESPSKRSSSIRSFSNECRAESGHYNYELNEKLKTDSCSGNITNCSQKKQAVTSSSSFVYEETNQGRNITHNHKGPIKLDITGWHELVKRNPEDKESYLYFKPDFLGEEEKENYFQQLRQSIAWQEKEITIRGEKYLQPRLVAWYGPLPYSYSNAVLEPNCEFPPIIKDIKERIENILKEDKKDVTFNSVLLNLYRGAKDSVAWHSDDELSMGIHPTIASISLGETRRFEMKLKKDQAEYGESPEVSEMYVIHLTSGSLLVMDGAMQEYWLHRVPKEFHDKKCRINLTFRTVYPTKEGS